MSQKAPDVTEGHGCYRRSRMLKKVMDITGGHGRRTSQEVPNVTVGHGCLLGPMEALFHARVNSSDG